MNESEEVTERAELSCDLHSHWERMRAQRYASESSSAIVRGSDVTFVGNRSD